MSDFPSLKPAMTVLVEIDAPVSIGSVSRGARLDIVPMPEGSVRSEPGFEPAIDATFSGSGNDYIRGDPDGKHMRLDAHAVAKDKSGGLFYIHYRGVLDVTEGLIKILSGDSEAKTTDFGNSFIEISFESGDEKLKQLESMVFVGAGRFIYEAGKRGVVEYKIAKVVKGG